MGQDKSVCTPMYRESAQKRGADKNSYACRIEEEENETEAVQLYREVADG